MNLFDGDDMDSRDAQPVIQAVKTCQNKLI